MSPEPEPIKFDLQFCINLSWPAIAWLAVLAGVVIVSVVYVLRH